MFESDELDDDDDDDHSGVEESKEEDDESSEWSEETRRYERVLNVPIPNPIGMTKSGRTVKPVKRLLNEMSSVNIENEVQKAPEVDLSTAEENLHEGMNELGEINLLSMGTEYGIEPEFNVDEVELDGSLSFKDFASKSIEMEDYLEPALVGAGLGGGFQHTSQLIPMKYHEAMASPDRLHWMEAIDTEWNKMHKYGTFREVPWDEVPADARIMDTTWAMKQKANGQKRARITLRGFKQIDGMHYHEDDKSAPVINDITVRVMLTFMLMAGYTSYILDIVGAFLHGHFSNDEKIYTTVPKGFERYYPKNCMLQLMKTLYGCKQAALEFWREMNKAFLFMKYARSKADPCLRFKWFKDSESGRDQLVIWMLWVDDCLIIGPDGLVTKAKEEMKSLFDCDDVGEMKEYVGCKMDRNPEDNSMRITQPVLIQSLEDEFDIPDSMREPKTPAEAYRLTNTRKS